MKKILISLLFLLSPTYVYAVCTANLTVCPSGCDYSVVNDAVTDLETNCATPTEPLSIEISGTWSSDDTTAIGVSGITTSATNDLTIYATGAARNDGTAYKSGAYITTGQVTIATSYTTLDGIIIERSGSDIIGISASARYSLGIVISNNVISGSASNTAYGIIYARDGRADIFNNVIYGFYVGGYSRGDGISSSYEPTAIKIYSNTLYGNWNGTKCGTGIVCKNNLSVGNVVDYNGYTSSDYNGCSDTTCNGGNDITGLTTSIFASVTGGSEDLHIVEGVSVIDEGDTLGSIYNVDIDGEDRPEGSAYDMGADEYVGGGGGEPPTEGSKFIFVM